MDEGEELRFTRAGVSAHENVDLPSRPDKTNERVRRVSAQKTHANFDGGELAASTEQNGNKPKSENQRPKFLG